MNNVAKLKPKQTGVDAFRRNVLATMEQKGLGPSDLARTAKVDRAGLSRFLNGHQEPTLAWCFVVAEALEVELSKLVDE